MIEPQGGHYDALIRVVRNPNDSVKQRLVNVPATADILDTALQAGNEATLPNLLYISDNGYDLSIKSTETILSMQQLMHRLGDLAADVNEYMNTGRAGAANTFEFGGYTAQAGECLIATWVHQDRELARTGLSRLDIPSGPISSPRFGPLKKNIAI